MGLAGASGAIVSVAKFKRIPAVYLAHGIYGIASKLTMLSPHPSVFFVGGNVLMCARTFKLPGILDNIARRYQIGKVSQADINELVQCGPEEDRATLESQFRRYLDRGAVGIAIRSEDRVVAYNWVFERTYDLMFSNGKRVAVQMTPAGVFLGNGYVEPSYRMRGLFPLLVRESALAFGEGRYCWSSTDLWNDISLASHLRMGFVKISTVSCMTIMGSTCFGHTEDDSRSWTLTRGGSLHLSDDRIVRVPA